MTLRAQLFVAGFTALCFTLSFTACADDDDDESGDDTAAGDTIDACAELAGCGQHNPEYEGLADECQNRPGGGEDDASNSAEECCKERLDLARQGGAC